ncbi:MAG: GMP synthase (glutamine-hydrolysing) [Candidatus Saganbacteria bacterium]|uniref:GMP synthase [glutamine-hydrolyzing] n=1 Tax=Candidatus Saganbacteria bacterium TaxID=2575572 RepID=A0A833L055_UNCSA|nr:MAG: GMP synthase (glutamine-hydrolysing) [Candidatus Saganbacteria bacterium]
MNHDFIAVLDFGAQYAMLIARRVRECNVYCEILPYNIKASELKKKNAKGIILSGGPSSVYDSDAPKLDKEILTSGIPILGICYGQQLISKELGGEVKPGHKKEYGKASLLIDDQTNLFAGLQKEIQCWMSHGDEVNKLPQGFKVLAHTANTAHAAVGNLEKKIFGVQFHPEVVHTPQGLEILKNFLYIICDVKPTWNTKNFIENALSEIRESVGNKNILCALSGGVDSTTVSVLVHQAVGKQLTCMFIDQGFMRKNEPEKIKRLFKDFFGINFIHINAVDRFFEKLKGVTDPEEKRHRIGNEFIRVFEEEAKKLGNIPFLAQGTLYPDVIESAVPGLSSTTAVRIKTHHNVGGLPKDIQFKLIEPLKMLFKDEVRALGKELGVPEEIVSRQPFPGPGLAIRIIGEVNKERIKVLQEVDDIVVTEIKNAGLYKKVWQSFAVLLPIRTVGVMGDKRTYLNTIALRVVQSTDAMTADWAKLPYELLEKISNRIINETPEINRVVYDISSKPPATIEWE